MKIDGEMICIECIISVMEIVWGISYLVDAIDSMVISPQAIGPQTISSSNSVPWKTRRNFGLKSRLIFWGPKQFVCNSNLE